MKNIVYFSHVLKNKCQCVDEVYPDCALFLGPAHLLAMWRTREGQLCQVLVLNFLSVRIVDLPFQNGGNGLQ